MFETKGDVCGLTSALLQVDRQMQQKLFWNGCYLYETRRIEIYRIMFNYLFHAVNEIYLNQLQTKKKNPSMGRNNSV